MVVIKTVFKTAIKPNPRGWSNNYNIMIAQKRLDFFKYYSSSILNIGRISINIDVTFTVSLGQGIGINISSKKFQFV